MDSDRWSAFLSLGAAIAVVSASYLQWWQIGVNGEMRTRPWVKLGLLPGTLIVLVTAAVLLVFF